jgi:hypothetical protein
MLSAWRYSTERSIIRYSWGGAFFQAPLIASVILGFLFVPPPGFAVAVLSVTATVMAVRTDRFTRIEQVIWIFLAGTLCFIELRAIDQDREDHNKQQAEIQAQSETDRRRERRQFADLLDQGKYLLGQQQRSSRETINQLTGGNSWAWFMVVPNTPTGRPPTYELLMGVEGEYPLHDVVVTLRVDSGMLTNGQGNVLNRGGSLYADQNTEVIVNKSTLLKGMQGPMGLRVGFGKYHITLYSRNGYIGENLELTSKADGAFQTVSVERPGNSNKGIPHRMLRKETTPLTVR